jgi:hypothetical protein
MVAIGLGYFGPPEGLKKSPARSTTKKARFEAHQKPETIFLSIFINF